MKPESVVLEGIRGKYGKEEHYIYFFPNGVSLYIQVTQSIRGSGLFRTYMKRVINDIIEIFENR